MMGKRNAAFTVLYSIYDVPYLGVAGIGRMFSIYAAQSESSKLVVN